MHANVYDDEAAATAETEKLIARFYGVSSPDVAALVSDYPEAQRVDLAAYCYSRSHLYELALAIAATCDIGSLAGALGLRGEHLYAQSRRDAELAARKPLKRGLVTLASSVGRSFPALDAGEERLQDA